MYLTFQSDTDAEKRSRQSQVQVCPIWRGKVGAPFSRCGNRLSRWAHAASESVLTPQPPLGRLPCSLGCVSPDGRGGRLWTRNSRTFRVLRAAGEDGRRAGSAVSDTSGEAGGPWPLSTATEDTPGSAVQTPDAKRSGREEQRPREHRVEWEWGCKWNQCENTQVCVV
jgi:hypothetical protein